MRIVLLACLAVLGLSVLPASPQPVEPGKEGELGKLLMPDPGKKICFARTYSADHLKKHPDQQVSEIKFYLTYYRHEPDKYAPQGQRNYYFALLAKLRGSTKTLESGGECSANGARISCNVDCDGGGVRITPRPDGKLLVSFADADSYIRMSEGCDAEENAIDLKPGSDDKEFLLAKTEACPAYDDW